MQNRKYIYAILALLISLAAVLFFVASFSRNESLQVVFFDVGQGDSILISQGSNQILVDGGKDGKILLEKLGKTIPFWDRKIETIIETHPDQDHIGGLIDVFEAYEVKTVIKTNQKSESKTFEKLEEKITSENSEVVEASENVSLQLPGSLAKIQLIYPFSSIGSPSKNESNDNSVVARLVCGENSFILMGDLSLAKEELLLASDSILASDIIKIAHHGSKYSTSEKFLEAVKPKEAIISVGKNNSYGHPDREIIERLSSKKIKVYRTDEMGDISYVCQNGDCQRTVVN